MPLTISLTLSLTTLVTYTNENLVKYIHYRRCLINYLSHKLYCNANDLPNHLGLLLLLFLLPPHDLLDYSLLTLVQVWKVRHSGGPPNPPGELVAVVGLFRGASQVGVVFRGGGIGPVVVWGRHCDWCRNSRCLPMVQWTSSEFVVG